jgi:hypothetical protein
LDPEIPLEVKNLIVETRPNLISWKEGSEFEGF